MNSHMFTIAGAEPVDLTDLADCLRAQIEKNCLQLATHTLGVQSGVEEVLVVVKGHEEPHIHPESDLIVCALEGGGSFWLRDGLLRVPLGGVAVIPKGVCHAFYNESEGDTVLLATFSPPPSEGNAKAPCPP